MTSKKTSKCVKSILERIDSIEKMCAKNGVNFALKNEELEQATILMALVRIFQQFKILQKSSEQELLEPISQHFESLKKLTTTIINDFDNLDFTAVKQFIDNDLPKVKAKFTQIL